MNKKTKELLKYAYEEYNSLYRYPKILESIKTYKYKYNKRTKILEVWVFPDEDTIWKREWNKHIEVNFKTKKVEVLLRSGVSGYWISCLQGAMDQIEFEKESKVRKLWIKK